MVKIVLIIGISTVSILFRWLAFNRVDSVALELSLVSFSVRVVETLIKYQEGAFSEKDIQYCGFLFGLVLLLSGFHAFSYQILTQKIRTVIDRAKPQKGTDTEKTKELNELKRQALENTLPLARHAIFLSYSYFLEERLGHYLRKGKKNARENYAKLIISLAGGQYTVEPSDLLLPTPAQLIGLLIFLGLGILSVVLAVL